MQNQSLASQNQYVHQNSSSWGTASFCHHRQKGRCRHGDGRDSCRRRSFYANSRFASTSSRWPTGTRPNHRISSGSVSGCGFSCWTKRRYRQAYSTRDTYLHFDAVARSWFEFRGKHLMISIWKIFIMLKTKIIYCPTNQSGFDIKVFWGHNDQENIYPV